MKTPVNFFKQKLQQAEAQIGLWQGLANPLSTEICAGAGFDWLLLDGEHSPNDLRSLLAQAHVIAAYPATHAVARVPVGEAALIKQYLDIGLQNILVPMVDTPEQAIHLAQACRYPQDDDAQTGRCGIRGMAGARASRWGRYPAYAKEANAQVCLLVQIESRTALKNLDAIAAVDGVDGVFIGPADLSASMGHIGNAAHPEVQAAIEDAIARILKAGKAAGILTTDLALAKRYISLGVRFIAVGLDTTLLVRATDTLLAQFKTTTAAVAASKDITY